MSSTEVIGEMLADNQSHASIVRRVFLTDPAQALIGLEKIQFEVLDSIAQQYSIPIVHVQIAGSAKTGRSYHKRKNFNPLESDLDVAIIDSGLYVKLSELIYEQTRSFSDMSAFQNRKGVSTVNEYRDYLAKGIFRPDLMPAGKSRAEWGNYFGNLSRKYSDYFKEISAVVYLSQYYFECKQRSTIKSYIADGAGND